MNLLKSLLKHLPTALLSFLLAITVWIIAVTTSDPTETGRFPGTVTPELSGLGENLMMTNNFPDQFTVYLKAPASIFRRITNERITGKAIIDVTGLEAGDYELPIKVKIGIAPLIIASYSPQTVKVTLQNFSEELFPVQVQETGVVPVAFKAETPFVTPAEVKISGAKPDVDSIDHVRVILDHSSSTSSIQRDLTVAAIDSNGNIVKNVTISPEKVSVSQEINLRGGYRVVAAKIVTTGQISNGYRVTKIGVDPTYVTIYSSDRELLDSLPSYLNTEEINLGDITDNISKKVGLIVPDGVTLVGDQSVNVNINVEMVEGTVTLSEIPVNMIGLDDGYTANFSPNYVDVYLTGPLPLINQVKTADVYVSLELQDLKEGNYQVEPKVSIKTENSGITVNSVIPSTIEVTITQEGKNSTGESASEAPIPASTAQSTNKE